ncbi:hypothetical protein MASR2M8_19640 [Opitutaceae bacterium]
MQEISEIASQSYERRGRALMDSLTLMCSLMNLGAAAPPTPSVVVDSFRRAFHLLSGENEKHGEDTGLA